MAEEREAGLSPEQVERARRRAEAMRANLRRRKEQQRARDEPAAKTGDG